MKTAKKRKVKSNVIGRTKSGYARYKNWIYSVDDFFLWMEKTAFVFTKKLPKAKITRTFAAITFILYMEWMETD